MASLYSIARKSGRAWRIELSNGDVRTTISLGKMPKKTAELCLSMVEQIAAANAAGQSYSVEVATWTQNIGDELHTKLVNAGLLRQRQRRTLGKFIADYIEERSDWKPGTRAAYRTSMKKLIAFFGKDTPLEGITAEQCHKYKAKLLQIGAQGSVAKNIERARNLFRAAEKRKLIVENPFSDVVAGRRTNHETKYFVTIEEAQALMNACNSPKQRLIIALARYAGLRCPSELAGLKWSEVNWERSRFIVHSPKTEGQGKSKRIVPIFQELYPLFREAFEAAPEGIDRVYPEITPEKSLGSFITKIATRAGIVLWEKPFNNMRSTRATELVEIYPSHIVNEWMGHTEAVAMAHYRQATGKAAEKFFEQAAGIEKTPTEKMCGKTVGESAGTECSGVETQKTGIAASSCISTSYNAIHNPLQDKNLRKVTPTGIEPVPRP